MTAKTHTFTLKELDHQFYSRIKELELRCDETAEQFDNIQTEDIVEEFEYLADQLMSIGMTRKELVK